MPPTRPSSPPEPRWFIYLIQSEKTGQLYGGSAKDPVKRLRAHNAGKGAKFTRGRGPWRLLGMMYAGPSRSTALHWEYVLKQMSREKKLAWCAEWSVDGSKKES